MSSVGAAGCKFRVRAGILLCSFPSAIVIFTGVLPSKMFVYLRLTDEKESVSAIASSADSFSMYDFEAWNTLKYLHVCDRCLLPTSL